MHLPCTLRRAMKFHQNKLLIQLNGHPLRLSSADKQIAGFCAGLAECFHVKPNTVHILWLLFSIFSGVGIFLYFTAAYFLAESSDPEP